MIIQIKVEGIGPHVAAALSTTITAAAVGWSTYTAQVQPDDAVQSSVIVLLGGALTHALAALRRPPTQRRKRRQQDRR